MAYKAAKVSPLTIQKGTDNVLVAKWTWNASHTAEYSVCWRYDTGNGVWFNGSESTVKLKNCIYTIPENARRVAFRVRPISETYKSNNKETSYFTASWSSWAFYNVSGASVDPEKPSAPTVKLTNLTLSASLVTYDAATKYVQFKVVNNDKKVVKTVIAKVTTAMASVSGIKISAGQLYKVCCRGAKITGHTTSASLKNKLKALKKPKLSDYMPKTLSKNKKTAANQKALANTKYQNALSAYKTKKSSLEKAIRTFVSTAIYSYGKWSPYSEDIMAVPGVVSGVVAKAISETAVNVSWNSSETATSYTVEYAKNAKHFDRAGEVSSVTSTKNSAYITGLESGLKYFFRVKATNSSGDSGWSEVVSVIIGKKPSPPTTWSSTTTCEIGDSVYLYWTHNTEDGSTQIGAHIQYTINGTDTDVYITEGLEDGINSYELVTPEEIADGTDILWKVRTKGVTDEYSDWSTVKAVTYNAAPTVHLEDVSGIPVLTSLPMTFTAVTTPEGKPPVSMSIEITSKSSYEDSSSDGTKYLVKEGDSVFQTTLYAGQSNLSDRNEVSLSASDLNLQNGMDYTITVTIANGAGMVAEVSQLFSVDWEETLPVPDAEISIDEEELCAYISPYCKDENEEYISDVLLSVYRRDANGELIEIASEIDNSVRTVVTDPHPALDYARYRVVATSKSTGYVEYYDIPGYPIGESAIVIQWDEEWRDLEEPSEDAEFEPTHSGSMVKLPYNISTSEDNSIDTALVEYIGRKRPVSYYGTQLRESANWTTEIPKDDTDTIFQLRRLSIYSGDCYVREPYGTGYWAHVEVSIGIKYDKETVPISISVKRVEGGA